MAEFKPGDVFVGHRIDGLAGRGGMGVVYRATDLDLERTVALKVITPVLAQEEDFRRRFVEESKAAASIEHPNVIPVYYAGEREGELFIVMRFIDGPDLRALVRAQGPLDPERAAHIVAQVGAALDAAHAHGLVHRDVKPANVLLGDDDHAYLTDFGLTKRSATSADGGGGTRAGGWVGTLGYVAPEQIRGERIDARTDVYALGCVLVYALTGNAPYTGDTDEATLWAHLNAPPPSESVPPEFEGVVARALAKDPSDRYPSAGDLGRAALTAAGRSAATRPERNVARGAAAPPGMSATAATARVASPDDETRASPAADGATVVSGREGAGSAGGGRAGALSGRRLLAAGAALVAAIVLAAVLLTGGGGDPAAEKTTTTPPPAQRAASVVGDPVDVGVRPNALTVAGGRIWVLSVRPGELDIVDPKTNSREKAIPIGDGGMSITGGFDSVWVLKGGRTRSLQRRSVASGRRIGPITEIAYPGSPVAVVSGQHALWVAVRTRGATSGSETVVKIDPSGLTQQQISIPGGVQDITVGEGALWVSNRFRSSVVRVDTGTLAMREIPVAGRPLGLAAGFGAVWVATRGDDTITRISPRGTQVKAIPVPSIPTRVAVGGGSVWATALEAGRLLRVDPERRALAERVDTGPRPFALDVVHGESVWLTLLSQGAVQPVTFAR